MTNLLRRITLGFLAGGIGLAAGCGGSTAGVHAVVPGHSRQMTGQVPTGGQYTLYRAITHGSQTPRVEPVWRVSANSGERVGFRWATVPRKEYDPEGLHLIAFAGGQTEDLGPYRNRNVEYLWAGSEGDVTSYFTSKGQEKAFDTVTFR